MSNTMDNGLTIYIILLSLFALPSCWAESIPMDQEYHNINDGSAKDHFLSIFEDSEEKILVRADHFSDRFDLSCISYSSGPYLMRFSSLYIENHVNETISCLLLYTSGVTRNQVIEVELTDLTLLPNGDLRIDILVSDTRGFTDAPDFTEYMTQTQYAYIVGINENDMIYFKAAAIPIRIDEFVNGNSTGPTKQIDLSVMHNNTVNITAESEFVSSEQSGYLGSFDLIQD